MKKLSILFAAVFASTITMAQLTPSAGIRAGLSTAGMRGDAVNNLNNVLEFADGMFTTGNRTGFFAGTYASIPLSENVSVEPALYYAQKGYAMKGNLLVKVIDFLGASANAQLKMHYIDVPVVLKANFGGFQVFAGPQVS